MNHLLRIFLLQKRSNILGSFFTLFSVVYIGLLIYTALLPVINLGFETPLHFDKVLHFFTYMILSFLLIQSFYHLFGIRRLKSYLTVVYISALVGALTEVLQHYFTDGARRAEIADFVMDVLGALSVFVLLILRTKEKN
ncbi:MAG: VanZ family protein [Planctomycetes bacterium]|nr:VanZ family protein [Planctomycetota bacterium]